MHLVSDCLQTRQFLLLWKNRMPRLVVSHVYLTVSLVLALEKGPIPLGGRLL